MRRPLQPSPPTASPYPYRIRQQNSPAQLPVLNLILLSKSRIGLVHARYKPGVNVYTQIIFTQLPWPELSFETVFFHLPADYPADLKPDALAEVSRVAWKRILVLAPTVPANLKGCFEMHNCFRFKSSDQSWGHVGDKKMILSRFETDL